MRADYCPMTNEPCQCMCDQPCSAHRLKPADDSDMAVYKAIAENYTAPQALREVPNTQLQYSDHIRRQHEAIVKLREALENYVTRVARDYGVAVGGAALLDAEQALKDTEGLA